MVLGAVSGIVRLLFKPTFNTGQDYVIKVKLYTFWTKNENRIGITEKHKLWESKATDITVIQKSDLQLTDDQLLERVAI